MILHSIYKMRLIFEISMTAILQITYILYIILRTFHSKGSLYWIVPTDEPLRPRLINAWEALGGDKCCHVLACPFSFHFDCVHIVK